jgi:PAS domain-containing protein
MLASLCRSEGGALGVLDVEKGRDEIAYQVGIEERYLRLAKDSVAISDALKTIKSDALEATLDALASGVYLPDREARIVYMNRAAERQVKTAMPYASRTIASSP